MYGIASSHQCLEEIDEVIDGVLTTFVTGQICLFLVVERVVTFFFVVLAS